MRRLVSTVFLLVAGLTALLAGTLPAAAQAMTSTVVSTSPNPSSAGQAVTFSATVSSGGAALVNGGTVTFSDNGTQISPAEPLPGGTATFVTSSLAIGTHTILAVFTPANVDAYMRSSGSTTHTVVTATATATPTPTVTPTGTMTATPSMTPMPTATATVTQPGAVVTQPGAPAPVPVGAVGTGGGGSLDGGASAVLLIAGSSLILAGAAAGAAAIARRRSSRRN